MSKYGSLFNLNSHTWIINIQKVKNIPIEMFVMVIFPLEVFHERSSSENISRWYA